MDIMTQYTKKRRLRNFTLLISILTAISFFSLIWTWAVRGLGSDIFTAWSLTTFVLFAASVISTMIWAES